MLKRKKGKRQISKFNLFSKLPIKKYSQRHKFPGILQHLGNGKKFLVGHWPLGQLGHQATLTIKPLPLPQKSLIVHYCLLLIMIIDYYYLHQVCFSKYHNQNKKFQRILFQIRILKHIFLDTYPAFTPNCYLIFAYLSAEFSFFGGRGDRLNCVNLKILLSSYSNFAVWKTKF